MAKIPEHKIEQIKDYNDIVEVISSYIQLKKKGQNYWAKCPFHDEKTASFSVSPKKQIFHCFGCGVGGNVINFVMNYEKITFIEAVKELAERVNVKIDEFSVSEKDTSDTTRLYTLNEFAANLYHNTLFSSKGKIPLEYLEKRGLSKQAMEKFKVGYAPNEWNFFNNKYDKKKFGLDVVKTSGLLAESKEKIYDRFRNRIIFPIYNLKDKPIAFGGRTLKKNEKIGKYINTPETPIYHKSYVLYGLNITKDIIRKSKEVLIVEGYMDFLQLFQNGFTNCVACSGTAFTTHHGKIILRYAETAILIYDGDDAGQKATMRAGYILTSQKVNCKILVLNKEDDPDSFLQEHGAEKFQKKIDKSISFISFLKKHYKFNKLNATQKSKIVTDIMDEIRQFPDQIYREMIIKDIAEEFKLEYESLLKQLRKKTFKSHDNSPQIHIREKNFKNQSEAAQYQLIQLLLINNSKTRKAGLKYITPDIFSHEFLSEVVAKVLEIVNNNDDILPEQIPEKIHEEKIRRFVVRLVMELDSIIEPEKTLVACLKQIEKQMIQDQYDDLSEQIQNIKNDDKANLELIKQQVKLMKDKKELEKIYTLDILDE